MFANCSVRLINSNTIIVYSELWLIICVYYIDQFDYTTKDIFF